MVFVAARRLSLIAASRGYSGLCGLLTVVAGLVLDHALVVVAPRLWTTGAIVAVHGLSCSTACGNLPAPGIEPVSPALAGGFFTTETSGKPL